MKGTVFDIRRFSIHDGPGIRTTVFLKGCPLDCLWCQNPEGRTLEPTLWYFAGKCIKCGDCIAACPTGSLSATDDPNGFISIDRSSCTRQGACVDACPTGAMHFIGREMTVEEVLAEVMKDELFYAESGGGLTLSGGDPLHQHGFSLALLRAAKEKGLDTAMETCLYTADGKIRDFIPVTDLFLADLKLIDGELHRRYTGVDNGPILRNFRTLADAGANILVRVPLIPGHTATAENLRAVRDYVRSVRSDIRIEALNFNPFARDKYRVAGIPYVFQDITAPFSESEMAEFRSLLE